MSHHVRFGRFRFEPLTARLWQGDREIKLTPKAAAVLGLLVNRAGQPVAKQELFASVWKALEILGRVFSRGWGKRDWVDQDPDYDCLRDDPRFKLLLTKLK